MGGFGGGDTRGLHCSYYCCQKTVERSPEGYLRRVFPSWLVLAVLLAFMTVSYMECRTYEQVVADRDYLIDKTQEQLYRMSVWLAVALTIYAVVLMLFLWARAIVHRHYNRLQNQQPLPKGRFD